MQTNGKRKVSQITRTNLTQTVWHHPPLLQRHPRPNTIPNWYDQNVEALITIVSELCFFFFFFFFAWQVKHSSHHIKDETVGGRFLAGEAPGRDPNNNSKERQCLHGVFTWCLCGEVISLWVMMLRRVFGSHYPLANKKETEWLAGVQALRFIPVLIGFVGTGVCHTLQCISATICVLTDWLFHS